MKKIKKAKRARTGLHAATPDLAARVRDADDLMSDIIATNDRLDRGEISTEHARAVGSNYKAAIKLLDLEIDMAQFTGRTANTVNRWFTRIAESEKDATADQTAQMVKQLKKLLAKQAKEERRESKSAARTTRAVN